MMNYNKAISAYMSEGPKTYYDILKLDITASDDDVKYAYRRMALIFHPDRNPTKRALAEKHFMKINEAYAALKTKAKRNAYNAEIKKLQAQRLKQIKADNDNSNKGFFANLAAFWTSGSDRA